MTYLLSDDPNFPILFDALALALTGNGSVFAQAAFLPLPNVQPIWSMPLLCSDYGERLMGHCLLVDADSAGILSNTFAFF